MKLIFLFGFSIWFTMGLSQLSDQELNREIDLLKAPQSPAAVMLGIAESEITRPSDVSDFMTSLRQATNSFNSIPVNYALEFSPHWALRKKSSDVSDFLSNALLDNISQSFTLSVANSNNNITALNSQSIANSALAVGIRFSFLRGKIDRSTESKLDGIRALMTQKNHLAAERFESLSAEASRKSLTQLMAIEDLNIPEEQKETKRDSISKALLAINAANTEIAYNQPELDQLISMKLSEINFTKVGVKLDFNSALVTNFPDRIYGNRSFDRAAAWLSGGIEIDSGLIFLAIIRGQYFAEDNLIGRAESRALDCGLRVLWPINKLTLSAEILYRNNKDIVDQGVKYLINFDYKVNFNMKLNFSFGKDFDGYINKEGNVISALNFLMGFGHKRNVGNPKT